MQIVIDISENTYRQVQALVRNGYFEHDICGNSMRRIANGTPLPKGHGRLIDADELKRIIQGNDVLNMTGFNVRICDINATPTIIKADKESEG